MMINPGTAISAQAAAFLRSPRGLSVLADLVSESPHQLGPGHDGRHEASGVQIDKSTSRQLASHHSGIFDSPEKLLVRTCEVISGWSWNPRARAHIRHLLEEKVDYSTIARELAEASIRYGWSSAMDKSKQVILVPPDETPSTDRTEDAARASIGRGSDVLYYGELTTTSTMVGSHLQAAQFCDYEIVSRMAKPIACWLVDVHSAAEVYELRGPSDLMRLVECYPKSAKLPQDWRKWNLPAQDHFVIDWSAMASEWDGMHVTMTGLLTAVDNPILMSSGAVLLEGFGSEFTVWFHNRLAVTRKLGDWDGQIPQ